MDRILFLCFFLSGLAGLIYQVVWLRWLILLFGATTLAISTVLTAFMGGLALGSWVAGRVAHRVRRPFLAYGLLELGVGAVALAFPALLSLSMPLFTWLTAVAPNYAALSLGRFVLVGAILLVPTTFMGATLPLLAQHIARRWDALGWNVGALYALNTLGAVVGTAAAAFLLLPTLGVSRANLVAVATNVAVGLTAALLGRRRPAGEPRAAGEADAGSAPTGTPAVIGRARLLLVMIAGSGVAAMVYEVAWSRALALVLGSSVYAFSVMLTTFLVGLALGSFLMARFTDRLTDGGSALALLQLGVAASSVVGVLLVPELPYLFVGLFRQAGGAYGWLLAGKFVIAGSILLGPTLLMGAVFPLVVRMVTTSLDQVGHTVGRVYAVNTVGAIVGSFAGGFVLIPWIGIRQSLLAAIALNLGLAFILLVGLPAKQRRLSYALAALVAVLVPALFVLTPAWNPLVLSSGVAVYAPQYRSATRNEFVDEATRGATLRFHREGLSTTVTTWEAVGGQVFLRVNGKTDASSVSDMPTQVLSGHLPLALHPDAQDVLVIGFGSGVTPGAVTRYPVRSITVVELEAAVIEASRYFEHVNHRPLQDPRTRLVVNDGRNFLLTTRDRYDTIISEPSNPWVTGASNLFTRDFFELGRSRLRDGGVFAQWLQLYGMDPAMVRSVARTFQAVFPNVLVFQPTRGDLLLLGSERPRTLDLARLRTTIAVPRIRDDLRRVDVASVDDLLARFTLGPADVRALTADAPINTDDNALIEFAAPRTLYANTLDANLGQLAGAFRGFEGSVTPAPTPPDLLRVAERYLARGRPRHADALARQVLARQESAEAHRLIGAVLLGERRDGEAIEHLRRALALEPTSVAALLTLAEHHVAREAYADALVASRQARAADPRSGRAAYLVGVSHHWLGAHREALVALDAAQASGEVLPKLPLHRGLALWRLGQVQAARDVLVPYVAAYPDDGFARYALGAVEFERGAVTEATVHWSHGVNVRSREANQLLARARTRAARGETQPALEDLETATKLDPLSAVARQELATQLERAGRTADAIRTWEGLLERFPNARGAHLAIGRLWQKVGDPARARESFLRYLDGEADPARAQAVRLEIAALR